MLMVCVPFMGSIIDVIERQVKILVEVISIITNFYKKDRIPEIGSTQIEIAIGSRVSPVSETRDPIAIWIWILGT